jgi:hypothetical protein
MKTIIYSIYCLLTTICISNQSIASENPKTFSYNADFFSINCVKFYNHLLKDQVSIEKLNKQRPKIYFYTDFGGGQNKERPLNDLQTSGEIASSAWKTTLHQELYINDSAVPLDPFQAALYLAKTFPYAKATPAFENVVPHIQAIVVHVIDPGVGNATEKSHPQPRSIVLRKDGILFIGPDNGTLSFACPQDSIARIWEINTAHLQSFSDIDIDAGGTFHGRDIFAEAAIRIAAKTVDIDDIGTSYANIELKNRFIFPNNYYKRLANLRPIHFETIRTERFISDVTGFNEKEIFDHTFLLGTIQSSLYRENERCALTDSKKIFICSPQDKDSVEKIGIINHKTGNIYIGPNNKLGTPFLYGFSPSDIEIVRVSNDLIHEVKQDVNNESVCSLLKKQPKFEGKIQQLQLFIYNGSTGSFGPNPHRSKRYVELTANGIFGKFGIDFFEHKGNKPYPGQVICFYFEYQRR